LMGEGEGFAVSSAERWGVKYETYLWD